MKIGDFGYARSIVKNEKGEKAQDLSEYVSTRWYRAPEVLYWGTNYSEAVDMWSVGCILAELLTRKVLLKGISTQDQLGLISKLIGSPSEEDLLSMGLPPEKVMSIVQQLPKGPADTRKKVSELFPVDASKESIDLLLRLLVYNPRKRLTAREAIQHAFFKDLLTTLGEDPKKSENNKINLPGISKSFEFDYRHLNTYQLKGTLFFLFNFARY